MMWTNKKGEPIYFEDMNNSYLINVIRVIQRGGEKEDFNTSQIKQLNYAIRIAYNRGLEPQYLPITTTTIIKLDKKLLKVKKSLGQVVVTYKEIILTKRCLPPILGSKHYKKQIRTQHKRLRQEAIRQIKNMLNINKDNK